VIPPVAIGDHVVHLGEVPTTMDVALALGRDGASSGTVVMADYQTSGRGRLDRRWDAPPGSSLLASVLLRTRLSPAKLTSFSLVLGMEIAPVLDGWLPDPCRLKWPNDLLAGDRKLGGILVRSLPDRKPVGDDSPVTLVIAGIGINVAAGRDDLPAGATSLREEGDGSVTVADVAARLWPALDLAWRRFEGNGGNVDLGGWRDRAAYVDEEVEISLPGGVRCGILRGVDPTGALCLEDESGMTHVYLTGDVSRGPIPVPSGATRTTRHGPRTRREEHRAGTG